MESFWKNLDTILLIALVIKAALDYIAPRTVNKVDDKINDAINWALNHAGMAFNIVEDLKATGLIKTDKDQLFKDELQKQYRKVYGKDLPEAAVSAAENIAAGLAAEDHNVKRLAATVNPQPAPAQ